MPFESFVSCPHPARWNNLLCRVDSKGYGLKFFVALCVDMTFWKSCCLRVTLVILATMWRNESSLRFAGVRPDFYRVVFVHIGLIVFVHFLPGWNEFDKIKALCFQNLPHFPNLSNCVQTLDCCNLRQLTGAPSGEQLNQMTLLPPAEAD